MKAIAYVREHGTITNGEYQTIAYVSKSTATRDLNIMKQKDIFISEGVTGRGTVYKLKGSKSAHKGVWEIGKNPGHPKKVFT